MNREQNCFNIKFRPRFYVTACKHYVIVYITTLKNKYLEVNVPLSTKNATNVSRNYGELL